MSRIERPPMRTPRLGIGSAPPASDVATQDITSLRDVATLGGELLTNGTFSGNADGWSLGANWEYGTNNVVHTPGAVEAISQNISVVSGTVYVVTFSQPGATAGSLTIAIGAVSVVWEYWQPVKSVTIVAGATGTLSFSLTPSTDYDGTLDDISVKAITAYTLPVARLLNQNGSVGVEIRAGGASLYNTAIGSSALRTNTSGYANTAIGGSALYANTTGYYNTAIGGSALYANTTGYYNTAIGSSALRTNTSGYANTAIGYSALRTNTTGYYNTAIGGFALYNVTGGIGNIALGYQAGDVITDGDYNIIIGYDIDPPAAGTNNYVNIGNIIKGTNTANGATAQLGFYGTEPINKPTVDTSGDTASDLANLLTALSNLGLITLSP